MALQKQSVAVSFAQGVDTKSDPKQVVPGKLLSLENAVFTSPGKAQLRNGFESLGSIENATAMASFNDEILALSSSQVQSLDANTGSWIDKGAIAFAGVKFTSIVSNTHSQTSQDGAINSKGMKVFAWVDGSAVNYTVIDTVTGSHVINNVQLHATATCPRVVSLNQITFIFYINTVTHHLDYKYISASTPTTISAAVTLATVKTTNQVFDAVAGSSRIFIFYVNNAGTPEINYINANFSSPITPVTLADTVVGPVTCFLDQNVNTLYLSWAISNKIRWAVYSYNLVEIQAPADVESVSSVRNITGAAVSGAGKLFYEIPGTLAYDTRIRVAPFTATVTLGSPASFVRSLGLGTKAFVQNDLIYVNGVYDSGLGEQLSSTSGAPQNKYILLNSSGKAVGKLLAEPNTAGGLTATNVLPSVTSLDGVNFMLPLLINVALTGFAFELNPAVCEISLDFGAVSTKVQLGNNLHIAAGAMLFMYDGASVVEHGYNFYPEPLAVTTHNTGGALDAKSYEWLTTFEWNDNQGQLHRSAPSVAKAKDLTGTSFTPVSFTAVFSTGDTAITVSSTSGLYIGQTLVDSTTGANLTAGTTITNIVGSVITIDLPAAGNSAVSPGDTIHASSTFSADLVLPTLRVTSKTNVNIVVYRTLGDGTLFYRAGSIANSTTADTVNFTDTISDYSLNFNEQLYTNGGVVENISMPATSLITQYQNRLMAVPAENPFQTMYSKQTGRSQGSALLSPVEFSADTFYFNIDQRGGPETSIGPLDDKFIMFKDNNIFFMYGQGPAPNGVNNDFSTPILITTDCGCTDQNSVVAMPLGLMFKSNKGIYLLDRSLTPKYVGADVEAYNSFGITSAQLIPNTNQVRFSLDDQQTILVYDYFVNQWTVFNKLNAADSVIVNNLYTYLDNNLNKIYQETPGVYTDDGAAISIQLKTSWLSFAGFQGFQRVYRSWLIGDYFSPHQLEVAFAYDFNPSIVQTTYINTQAYTQYPYGTDYTYGGTSPEGGQSAAQFQFGIFNKIQKCQAIQITIKSVPSVPYGQCLSLSGITFEVGAKKGPYKLPAARLVG